MRVVTSFSPARLMHQQKCVTTWVQLGCSVIGVQARGEAEFMRLHFSDIPYVVPGETEDDQPQIQLAAATIVETDRVGDVFKHPSLVRISAMLKHAVDEPILILNSDLELKCTREEFVNTWQAGEKELHMGIRWDYTGDHSTAVLLRYGIDAFLITPEIVADLPDIGMTMGCPGWDYWIPWQLNSLGYKLITHKEPHIFHANHNRHWSDRDTDIAMKLFQKHYNIANKPLAHGIQALTGRG